MTICDSQTYSGVAPINVTFAGATKTALVDNIAAELANAGWSVTGASGDKYCTTAAGAPGGFKIRVRIWGGGTNCITFALYSLDGESPSWDLSTGDLCWVLPSAATWRLIAGAYYFWLFQDGVQTTRTYAWAGVPFILDNFISGSPAIISSRVGYLGGGATGDTDSTARATFRNGQLSSTRCQTVFNSRKSSGTTTVTMSIVAGSSEDANRDIQWAGGAYATDLPEIQIPNDDGTPVMVSVGYLWDCWIMRRNTALDLPFSYDSKTWINLCGPNTVRNRAMMIRSA